MNRLLAPTVAVALVLLWGSNFSVLKLLMVELEPEAVLFARYIVTALCAVAVMCWRYGLRWPMPARRDLWHLAGLAFLLHVLHVSMMMHAIDRSTAFSSALISACGPLFTLLIVRVAGLQRFSRVQVIGVGLAFAGVLVFLSEKLGMARSQSVGDLLLLVATVLFSVYSVLSAPVIERVGALQVMAYTTLLGAVPIVLMNIEAVSAPWSNLPPLLWAGLMWSMVLSSFAGLLVWGWLTSVLGVARCAPLLYLLPLVAGVTAWAALGETFSTLKVVGAVVALLGVAAAQFGAPARVVKPLPPAE